VLRALITGQSDAAEALRSLYFVRIGSEVAFRSDIRQFPRTLPDTCHIQIGYSSTESTGTQWFVSTEVTPDGPFVPVGYVLPGNVASVLDETGLVASPGDVGELFEWTHGQHGSGPGLAGALFRAIDSKGPW
jgi:hypothetical protein